MEHEEQKYVEGMLERTGQFFTAQEMNRVRDATFAICGMGGVGSIAVELFARWGVKRFKLLDKDKYDYSNLNRQLFANCDTIGRWKVDVASDRIREINPFIETIELFNVRIDNENVKTFIHGADIVIQTGDSPSCKIIYEESRLQKVPLINGYSYPVGAYAQTYDFRNRACLTFADKLYERLKWRGKELSSMTPQELDEWDERLMHAPAATIGFITNLTGCLIGIEAIKLLTGRGKVCHYPKRIDFNAFDLKLKVSNPNSIFNPLNYIKLLKMRKTMNKPSR